MDADQEDTTGGAAAPQESGTLLELSADDPGTVDESLQPEAGEVTLQVSSEAVDVREEADGSPALPPLGTAWSLLLLASPRDRHDRFRHPLARRLLRTEFGPPLRAGRRAKLEQHAGAGPRKIRSAAEAVLVRTVALWGREEGRARYSDLAGSVRNTLNDDVARDLLGPDWKKLVGKVAQDPDEALDAPADGDEDGRTLLDQQEDRDLRFSRLESRLQLRRVIDAADLTEGERGSVLHTEIWGRTYREAADEMGTTPKAVSAMKSRGMRKLREAARAL